MPRTTAPPRATIAARRAAEKEALRGVVDALSDARAAQLATQAASIGSRTHLYRLANPHTQNRPKAHRLRDAAAVARQMAARLLAAADEAERVARESDGATV